MHASCGVEHAE